jgi:DNA-binding SARP family transcriptional activator
MSRPDRPTREQRSGTTRAAEPRVNGQRPLGGRRHAAALPAPRGRWRLLDAALQLVQALERCQSDALARPQFDARHPMSDATVNPGAHAPDAPAQAPSDLQRPAQVPPRPLSGAPLRAARPQMRPTNPTLDVYLLSPFRVFVNDHAIDEWPNIKGKAIFKYLVLHRAQPVSRDVLMNVFWPEADADAARNNLNVAMHGLRKALAQADPSYAYVLFRQGSYSFNPTLQMWVDAEAFSDRLNVAHVAEERGEIDRAVAAYRVAQAIYLSPLLAEDRYDDWLLPQRQGLEDSLHRLLTRLSSHYFEQQQWDECVAVCSRMLEADRCNEEAHRTLMRCYSHQGHTHLALRQYHFCVDALARELNLIPSPHTVALFQQIRQRQPV